MQPPPTHPSSHPHNRTYLTLNPCPSVSYSHHPNQPPNQSLWAGHACNPYPTLSFLLSLSLSLFLSLYLSGATAGRYGPISGFGRFPFGAVPPRGDRLSEPVRCDRSGVPPPAGREGHAAAAVKDSQRSRLRCSGVCVCVWLCVSEDEKRRLCDIVCV